MPTAQQHADIYQRLGIEVGQLGCIMLDTSPIDLGDAIAPEDYYRSPNPDRGWIDGPVAEHGAHVTLLYGLLTSMWPDRDQYERDVDSVLAGWNPPGRLGVAGIEVFPSTFEDEPYSCIVLRMKQDGLLEAHQRLTLLPHLQTFPEYKPHLTLAYVRKEAEQRARLALTVLLDPLSRPEPFEIHPKALNYGSVRRWEQAKATAA